MQEWAESRLGSTVRVDIGLDHGRYWKAPHSSGDRAFSLARASWLRFDFWGVPRILPISQICSMWGMNWGMYLQLPLCMAYGQWITGVLCLLVGFIVLYFFYFVVIHLGHTFYCERWGINMKGKKYRNVTGSVNWATILQLVVAIGRQSSGKAKVDP